MILSQVKYSAFKVHAPGIQIHNLCVANAKRSANWAMEITIMCIIFHLLEVKILC